jgi:iron complex outermembrane recepter protein
LPSEASRAACTGIVVNAESNSTADANGNIVVSPGDRIPLIPRQTGRLTFDYEFTQRWDLGATVVAASGSYLHGNENNANQPGGANLAGDYVEGSGWIPGYVVVNLEGSYRVAKQVQLFARVVNLLDKKYATAGFLTSNSFMPNGAFIANPNNWTNENAVSPAEPFGVWAGVRLTF